MLNSEEVSALGQIFNTTFGYSSQTMKVTSALHGNALILKFMSVIQFASEESMQKQMSSHEKDGNECIEKALKEMKAQFKQRAGRAIKVKEKSRDSDVQLVSVNPHTPRKVAYYRLNVHLEVE